LFVVIPHYNVGYFAKLVKFAEFYNNARPVPCSQEIGGRGSLFATSGALVSVVLPGTFGLYSHAPPPKVPAMLDPQPRQVHSLPEFDLALDRCRHPRPQACRRRRSSERPALHEITGADSPVIADSSIAARPWMTSPAPGTICLAFTTTRSPGSHAERGDAGRLSRRRCSCTSGRPWVPMKSGESQTS
jgi:hypothetical protein